MREKRVILDEYQVPWALKTTFMYISIHIYISKYIYPLNVAFSPASRHFSPSFSPLFSNSLSPSSHFHYFLGFPLFFLSLLLLLGTLRLCRVYYYYQKESAGKEAQYVRPKSWFETKVKTKEMRDKKLFCALPGPFHRPSFSFRCTS